MPVPEPTTRPWATTSSPGGMVCSVDHLASSVGAQALAAGGTAADAAVAASAVLAVASPHLCGMGGDLFAIVHRHRGPPSVLESVGWAGAGADPERLRAEGHDAMPRRGDVRSATVPGCVDGWCALHERFGRLPFRELLAPARRLAEHGFPASPLLAFMLHTLDGLEGCDELARFRPQPGERLVRPDLARTLSEVADDGRDGFYRAAFGRALLVAGAGEYGEDDLVHPIARWVDPLGARVWGHDLWTAPPVSQGYLSLLSSAIVEDIAGSDLPGPDDAAWVHLLVEASRLAAHDRGAVLHEAADGPWLIGEERRRSAVSRFDPEARSEALVPARSGDTMFMAAVDAEGMGVSLIQSNAADFGCRVAVPGTGVLLHNRGIGFSLAAGHVAEYAPGRRPPHTLSPALLTRPDGTLRAVVGTMGGDSQPQVVLQLATRLLAGGEDPGRALLAPRFVLSSGSGKGFDTWSAAEQIVRVEAHAPPSWAEGLVQRGHRVEVAGLDPAGFGHAHIIERDPDGMLRGAADVRAMTGAAVASV